MKHWNIPCMINQKKLTEHTACRLSSDKKSLWISLTSKDNRNYWIWVSNFLFGDPTCGLNDDPQHFDVQNYSDIIFRWESKGAHTDGTEKHRCGAHCSGYGGGGAALLMSQRQATNQPGWGGLPADRDIKVTSIAYSLPFQNASYFGSILLDIPVQKHDLIHSSYR